MGLEREDIGVEREILQVQLSEQDDLGPLDKILSISSDPIMTRNNRGSISNQ